MSTRTEMLPADGTEPMRERLKTRISPAPAVFMVAGLAMLCGACGKGDGNYELLKEPDVLFGVSTFTVLTIAGLLHLFLGGAMLLRKDLATQGILLLWAGWIHIAYWGGMLWMKAVNPIPAVTIVAWRFYLDPQALNWAWKMLIMYFIIGGALPLAAKWGLMKRETGTVDEKDWAQQKADWQTSLNKNQSPSPPNKVKADPRPVEIKFSCPNCGQHIMSDTSYGGRQINCPNCQKPLVTPQ